LESTRSQQKQTDKMNKTWKTTSNIGWMLRSIKSDRKLNLFAITCCKKYWDLLDDLAKEAIILAELRVNNEVCIEDIDKLKKEIEEAFVGSSISRAAKTCIIESGFSCAWWVVHYTRGWATGPENKWQCNLLRHMVKYE
jgi:hypothetical protein